jgi:hypothetical protein
MRPRRLTGLPVDDEGKPRFASIGRFELDGDSGVATLRLDVALDDGTLSPLSVRVSGLVDFRVCAGGGALHDIDGDHPLLRQLIDPRVSLFLRGSPQDPAGVAWELVELHHAACLDWIATDAFFNGWPRIDRVLGIGDGQLAVGPALVIDGYEHVLAAHGVRTTKLTGPGPESEGPLSGLVVGDSYFVAREIEVQPAAPVHK